MTENAPVTPDDCLVEGFLAGALAKREDIRNTLFEQVLDLPAVTINYDEYVKISDVLALIHRGD